MKKITDCFRFTLKYTRQNLIKQIVFVSAVFLITGVLAYFCMYALPKESLNEVYTVINQIFSEKDVVNPDGSLSFWGIFFNNLRAGAIISAVGFVPFLFLSSFYVALNAGIVGVLLGLFDVMTTENVFIMFVKFILPHGVFEIPAIILEGAIGSVLCLSLTKKIFRKEKNGKFSYHVKGCIGIFVLYVIPMIIIAAFIEAVVLSALYL